MNLSNALYFPDTAPAPGVTARLLLFFETVHHYLPTENIPAPEAETDASRAATADNDEKLLHAYAPAPLGPDLEIFNRQYKQLLNRPDQPGQLNTLRLALLSDELGRDQDEISSGSLINAMLKDGGAENSDRSAAELWQARLTLKLAETLDRQEREINEGLAAVTNHEDSLFKTLKGLEKEKGPAAQILDLFGPGRSSGALGLSEPEYAGYDLDNKRLAAWSRLYLADRTTDRPPILATAHRQTAAQVFEAYERINQQQAVELFGLPLPEPEWLTGKNPLSREYRIKRQAFRTGMSGGLTSLTEILRRSLDTRDFPAGLAHVPRPTADLSEAWQKAAAELGPACCLNLKFYCLPAIHPDRLLTAAGSIKESRATIPYPHRNTLLALITRS